MVLLPEAMVRVLSAMQGRLQRGFGIVILLMIALVLVSRPVGAEMSDRIVAVVEAGILSDKQVKTQIITASEVEETARPLLMKLHKKGESVNVEMVHKKVLDELILRLLREQQAAQMGVGVEERDLDAIMTQVEQNNRLPPGTLPEALAKQGIDLGQYRLSLREQLMKSRLINKVIRPLVSVSAAEIQALYQASRGVDAPQEVRLGQILLAVDPSASIVRIEEKAKLANMLLQKLRSGTTLASLAGQYSDDPSGLEGGEIGWFKRGELLPEMEEAVFGQNPGYVADPVRTSQGFHILVLLEKRKATPKAVAPKVKVKARHILIKVPSGASSSEEAKALERIQGVQKELAAGGDFKKLAIKYSQDETAKDGGNLGWFGAGLMVAPFEAAAFSLSPNELSEPVRTPFGWHLILVEEKKTLAPDSLEAQSKDLEERVLESKLQARYNQWLRDIRLRAFVEYR